MENVVCLSRNAFLKMKYLTKNTDKEVQAFIIGNGLNVEDLIVFDQEVSSSTTEVQPVDIAKFIRWCIKNDKRDLLPKIIGWFHSHVRMGCFWSGTDEENMELLGNTLPHVLSIVSNKAGNELNLRCRLDIFKPMHMHIDKISYDIETPDAISLKGKTIEEVIIGANPVIVLSDGVRLGINGIDIHDDSLEELCKKEISDKCKEHVWKPFNNFYPRRNQSVKPFNSRFDSFSRFFEETQPHGLIYIEEGIAVLKKFCDDGLKRRCRKYYNETNEGNELVTTTMENSDIRIEHEESLRAEQDKWRNRYDCV